MVCCVVGFLFLKVRVFDFLGFMYKLNEFVSCFVFVNLLGMDMLVVLRFISLLGVVFFKSEFVWILLYL